MICEMFYYLTWYRDSDDFSFFIRIHRDFWIVLALFFQTAERVCLANCGRCQPRGLYRFVVSESLLLSVLALLPGMVLFCFVHN